MQDIPSLLYEKDKDLHISWQDAGRLARVVEDIANGVFARLGPGMPRSLYQLMLCRQLAASGIMLESECLLGKCNQTDVSDEVLTLDRCLLLQCITAGQLDAARRQCLINLLNSNYKMAIMIEFEHDLRIHYVHHILPATASDQLH